ncbi:hypothetical protein DFP72DRAFT_885777 [Ephemerocybe angulata]|uniref:Uncharacterized protein n=1 Tax=Ephemerocybe angulata TaxID=980116 RepID=A0A8H6MCK1_9AGAR|nr:hypothetical protein DFP72DRAFT_885777 [Tulosesus angulatus]
MRTARMPMAVAAWGRCKGKVCLAGLVLLGVGGTGAPSIGGAQLSSDELRYSFISIPSDYLPQLQIIHATLGCARI